MSDDVTDMLIYDVDLQAKNLISESPRAQVSNLTSLGLNVYSSCGAWLTVSKSYLNIIINNNSNNGRK